MTGRAAPLETAVAIFGLVMLESTLARSQGAGESLSTAAPWAVPVAGGIAALALWPAAGAATGKGLSALALEAGGRPAAIAATLLMTGALTVNGAVRLQQAAEIAGMDLGGAAIFLTAAAAAGFAAGPWALLWASAAATGAMLPFVLLVLLGNLPWADWRNLLPASGHGLLPAAGSILPLTGQFTSAVLPMLSGFCQTERRTLTGVLLTAAVAAGLASAVELAVLPGAGPYPFAELTRLAGDGLFPTAATAAWLTVTALGSAALLALTLAAAAALWRDSFSLPDPRSAIWPMAVIMLALSRLPGLQPGGALILMGLPPALALTAALRRRRPSASG